MNSYDRDHINLVTCIENDDVHSAAEIFTERFHKKLLHAIGTLQVTAVQLAAWQRRTELLDLFYKRGADINAVDKIGRCALFHAAHRGNSEVVKWLLERGAFTESRVGIDSCSNELFVSASNPCFIGRNLPTPDCWGRTPLHQAVKNNHSEVVKILVNAGADVNTQDERGITPLLLAGSTVTREDSIEMSKFAEIVDVLVSAKAETNTIHPDTGTTALHTAAALGSPSATKKLLDGGAWPLCGCKSTGSTPLHLAASTGCPETLSILLNSIPSDQVDFLDNIYRTPLHKASYQGHCKCIELLIDHGGNLAAKTKTGVTVIDAIFEHIPRPVSFLTSILDSRINANSMDKHAQIVVDFNMLTPKGELQMGVVTSLIAAASNVKQLSMLQHPLMETFLWLKWSELRVFFLSLVFVHVLLVLSLSGYAIMVLHHETDYVVLPWILTSCSCIVHFHNMAQVFMVPRYYLKTFETWLSFVCTVLTLVISLNSDHIKDITVPSREKELNGVQHPPQWMMYSISLAILLSWMQMMLLVGRLPICGYYALMFSTVLNNILKVLLAFVCLIVGFAFSFAVMFHENDQFRNFWWAVVKTVVMMMGEYEYATLFPDEKNGGFFLPVTSRVMFLAFIMLASIVLMNLMIGLAVNDIQGIEKEGRIRQLLKQAEFVSHLEMLTSHQIFRCNWLHPWLARQLHCRRNIPTKITFNYNESYFHESSLNVPVRLKEALFLLASKNSRDCRRSVTSDKRENNNGDNNAELKALLKEVLLQLKMSYYSGASGKKFSKPFETPSQTDRSRCYSV